MAKSKLKSAEDIIHSVKQTATERDQLSILRQENAHLHDVVTALSGAYNDLVRKLSRAGIPQKKKISAAAIKKSVAKQNKKASKSKSGSLAQSLRSAVQKA